MDKAKAKAKFNQDYEKLKTKLLNSKAVFIMVIQCKHINIKFKITNDPTERYKPLFRSKDKRYAVKLANKLAFRLRIKKAFHERKPYYGSWDEIIARNIPYLISLINRRYRGLKSRYVNDIINEVIWHFMQYKSTSYDETVALSRKAMPYQTKKDVWFNITSSQQISKAYERALGINRNNKNGFFDSCNERFFIATNFLKLKEDLDPIEKLNTNDKLIYNDQNYNYVEENVFVENFIKYIRDWNDENFEGENAIVEIFIKSANKDYLNKQIKPPKYFINKIKLLYSEYVYGDWSLCR